MNEPTRCCALCGHPLMRRSKPFVDLRDVQCTTCGGYGVRAPDDERGTLRAVLCAIGWWAVVIVSVMFVAWCMNPRTASAEERGPSVTQQLREDITAQARAQSLAEGGAGIVPCFQERRHGQAAVCITRGEWLRQHADDRTAQPEQRVGMRL